MQNSESHTNLNRSQIPIYTAVTEIVEPNEFNTSFTVEDPVETPTGKNQ